MIVPVMAISNLVLTRQIHSEETNRAHAHYREPVPLNKTDFGNRKRDYRTESKFISPEFCSPFATGLPM